MAIVWDAPVTPDALTTFVRQVPQPQTFALTALAGTTDAPENKVDVGEVIVTNRTARYRPFDGAIHVSKRDYGTVSSLALAPLSTSSPAVGEYERLQLQFARTGGTFVEALEQAVYNDGERGAREIHARIEQGLGQVLSTGKLTINEGGLISEADFGVPSGQIVTAGTSWATTASATALTNLVTWCDVYNTNNGFMPGSIVTSRKQIRLLQQNAEIIDAAYGSETGRTRVKLEDLNDLLSSEELPTLRAAYDTVVDVDGTTTRCVADDKVIFLPPDPSAMVAVAWGVSATALELVNSNVSEMSFTDAPGIVAVVEKNGPPYREFTFVDAVALPVLVQPKLLMVADVAP